MGQIIKIDTLDGNIAIDVSHISAVTVSATGKAINIILCNGNKIYYKNDNELNIAAQIENMKNGGDYG